MLLVVGGFAADGFVGGGPAWNLGCAACFVFSAARTL